MFIPIAQNRRRLIIRRLITRCNLREARMTDCAITDHVTQNLSEIRK